MFEESIGNKLMQMTRYGNMGFSPQKQGKVQPPIELPIPSDAKLIELKKPGEWKFRRRTCRI